jgi:ammonium transporter, Amt family
LTSFFITYIKYKVADVGMTLNGALAGLVGITTGCANVSPLGAIIIGFISGILVVFSVTFFDKLKIDDPVGAISITEYAVRLEHGFRFFTYRFWNFLF